MDTCRAHSNAGLKGYRGCPVEADVSARRAEPDTATAGISHNGDGAVMRDGDILRPRRGAVDTERLGVGTILLFEDACGSPNKLYVNVVSRRLIGVSPAQLNIVVQSKPVRGPRRVKRPSLCSTDGKTKNIC